MLLRCCRRRRAPQLPSPTHPPRTHPSTHARTPPPPFHSPAHLPPHPAPPLPGFVLYACCALALTLYLIFGLSPEVQNGNLLVYVAICSIVGSLSGRC